MTPLPFINLNGFYYSIDFIGKEFSRTFENLILNKKVIIVGVLFGASLGLSAIILKHKYGNPNENIAEKLFNTNTTNVDTQYRMAFILRDDLNLSKGKIVTQCSNLSINTYKEAQQIKPELLKKWESDGQLKSIFTVENENAFDEIRKKACKYGISTKILYDSEFSQLDKSDLGSKIILSIGPGEKSTIDKLTKKLKPY